MKLHINSLIACMLLLSVSAMAQDWTSMSDLPNTVNGRHHPITFSLNGDGYYMTGQDANGIFGRDMYKYDAAQDDWTQLPNFPGAARGFSIGIAYDDKAYVGFGTNGASSLSDLWVYDPMDETWENLKDCPCLGRFHPALLAADGKIYVGLGGNSEVGDLEDWWAYDIATDSWEQKAVFPGGRRHHPYQFSIGEYLYVGFGHQGPNIYNNMFRYDPSDDSWLEMATLPSEGRVAGTQFSYNGKGYLLSGDGDNHNHMSTGEFWEYDPLNDSWTSLPPHPGQSRWAPGSFVIDNKVFFTSGLSSFGLRRDLLMYEFENTTSIKNEAIISVDISPNPAVDFIQVNAKDLNGDIDRLQIFDQVGKLIFESKEQPTQKIDVSHFVSGQYFVHLISATDIYTGRFIKNE